MVALKYLLICFFLLKVGSFAHAEGGWNCNDGDVVLCWGFSETDGATAFDASTYGYNGTLTGGPARVLQQNSFATLPLTSTNTVAMFPPRYIFFTRTAGEHVTGIDDARYDFAGKTCMICATFYVNDFNSANQSIVAYSNSNLGNATKGWHFRQFGSQLIFGHIGVNDFTYTKRIPDLKPHAYCAWDNEPLTIVALFRDGDLDSVQSTAGALKVSGTVQLSVGRTDNAGFTEWSGGFANLKIRKIPPNATLQEARRLAAKYFAETLGMQ